MRQKDGHLLAEGEDIKYTTCYMCACRFGIKVTGDDGEGMFYLLHEKDMKETQYTVWDKKTNSIKEAHIDDVEPMLLGTFKSSDEKTLKISFQLFTERVMEDYSLEKASVICGVLAEQIERIGLEIGIICRNETIELPIPWIDAWGKKHKTTTGHPVSVHGMRGLAAHSNSFQTIRAFSLLLMMLGIIDGPGGFRYKPPYPRPVPHYHSWDGQNAWLRQIIGQNFLYINSGKAAELGIRRSFDG